MSAAIKYLPHYTYEDYCQWEGRWELIDGIPYSMSPAPVYKHQSVNTKIFSELIRATGHCDKSEVLVAPFDWKIKDSVVVQPDILVVCGKVEGDYLTFPPAVIFEILSPSTAEKDRTIKYEIYQSQGVKYYILADPDKKSAEVFELKDKNYFKIEESKTQELVFDIDCCKIKFNFNRIW